MYIKFIKKRLHLANYNMIFGNTYNSHSIQNLWYSRPSNLVCKEKKLRLKNAVVVLILSSTFLKQSLVNHQLATKTDECEQLLLYSINLYFPIYIPNNFTDCTLKCLISKMTRTLS